MHWLVIFIALALFLASLKLAFWLNPRQRNIDETDTEYWRKRHGGE